MKISEIISSQDNPFGDLDDHHKVAIYDVLSHFGALFPNREFHLLDQESVSEDDKTETSFDNEIATWGPDTDYGMADIALFSSGLGLTISVCGSPLNSAFTHYIIPE